MPAQQGLKQKKKIHNVINYRTTMDEVKGRVRGVVLAYAPEAYPQYG